jgi:hypothetical protein
MAVAAQRFERVDSLVLEKLSPDRDSDRMLA